MEFNEKSRKLTSSTGYICALDGSLYTNYAIYLGKLDSPKNYIEGTKEEYEAWLKTQEEKISGLNEN